MGTPKPTKTICVENEGLVYATPMPHMHAPPCKHHQVQFRIEKSAEADAPCQRACGDSLADRTAVIAMVGKPFAVTLH
jgi:hypothetical protein